MVAKTDLLTAAESIEKALQAFAHGGTTAKALVFESYPGHLRALVGHNAFHDMSLGARQDLIWVYLNKHVEPEHLAYLYGVHPLDPDEYDARYFEVSKRLGNGDFDD